MNFWIVKVNEPNRKNTKMICLLFYIFFSGSIRAGQNRTAGRPSFIWIQLLLRVSRWFCLSLAVSFVVFLLENAKRKNISKRNIPHSTARPWTDYVSINLLFACWLFNLKPFTLRFFLFLYWNRGQTPSESCSNNTLVFEINIYLFLKISNEFHHILLWWKQESTWIRRRLLSCWPVSSSRWKPVAARIAPSGKS